MSTISVKAANYDFKAANSDGVTIYYKVNGENATVVAGDEKYTGVVNIPEIVTNDGKDYTINMIGFGSFAECNMLTNVLIPNSVTIVEDYAFGKDVQLTSVEFPNSIEKLGQGVCNNCTNLSSVHLPSSIKEIPKWAFHGTALKTIEIPYGVQNIDEGAFATCPIEKVIIPNSVVAIGVDCFSQNSNLKEIIIPSSVKSIGNRAFNSTVSAIEKVTVMNKQPFEIPSGVFSYGSTRNATLYVPAGTKAIYQTTSGWGDFANIVEMEPEDQPYAVWCEGNTTLYFLTSTEVLAEGGTYNGQTITKVWSGKDITESEEVPAWNNVVKSTLTEVVFSHNFKEIMPFSTASWFKSCANLKDIRFLSNLNTSKVTTMHHMFYGCYSLSDLYLDNFDTGCVIDMRSLFYGCSGISKLVIDSFNTSFVESVDSMFCDCTALETIYVGNGWNMNRVKSHRDMFENCYKIRGGNGTTYNSSYTNVTYARIDTEDTPGYLTFSQHYLVGFVDGIQTLCYDHALDFSEVKGLKAYIASGFSPSTGEVIMSRVDKVPARTGLLLIGEPDFYEVPFAETDFVYSNLFRGLLEDVEVTSGYVLEGDEFVAIEGTKTVKGGEAYLNIAPVANASRLKLRFADTIGLSDAAGIDAVLLDDAATPGVWYTLQGVRLNGKPSKPGVYVRQGRKVVVK